MNDRIKSTRAGRCQDHLSSQSIKAECGGFDSLPRQHEAPPSWTRRSSMTKGYLWACQQTRPGLLMEQVESLYGSFWKTHVTCWLCNSPLTIECWYLYTSHRIIYIHIKTYLQSLRRHSQIWTSVEGSLSSEEGVVGNEGCLTLKMMILHQGDK